MNNEHISITGVHLYTVGERVIVAIEVDGKWTPIIEERAESIGPISHICEPGGMRRALGWN